MRSLIALGAAALVGLGAVAPVAATTPRAETFTIAGLDRPVRLIEDHWGVPHIFARTTGDAFLAQGFNAARERLFQIDLWRRRGLGLLAEVLGPSYVEQDAANRLFRYRGDMAAEWAAYGPDGKMAATRYTAGVNAYVDWLTQHPRAMPEEFRLLGYVPSHWQPADVVRIRSHGLVGNVSSEVTRSRVACAGGLPADRLRVPIEPAWDPVVPDGFDPCTLPTDVLRTYQLATQPVAFTGSGVRAVPTADGMPEGSNNWTIGPQRTATGRAILANDPHRAYGAPSLRYISHLSAPGLDAIGAGEPSQPGISMGHNGTVAFGLTIFPVDQEDLYVYQLDPNDPTRYRYGTGFEPMTMLRERVPVAGEQPREVRLSFTRHGPVVKVDEQRHVAYAIRTAWSQPGMSPYYGSLKLMRAHTFTEFKSAMRDWGSPSENQVYADTDGNIGWVPGGMVPKRPNHDGLLPVPGDGRYEWDGFHTGDDLPSSLNPDAGFIATANQLNLPPDYPYQERKLGFEWADPARYNRIAGVLSTNPSSSVADSTMLQTDQLSLTAQRIVALLADLPAPRSLKDWNGVADVDSAPAALYEVWRKRHLGPGLLKAVTPAAAGLIVRPDNAALVNALEHPENWFGDNAATKRDELLTTTLDAAYAETTSLLGPDPAAWRWGDLQHSLFEHPLAPIVDDATRARLNVGPFPRGGDENTVNASGFRTTDFQHTSGPSFRMVLDVGNWDASLAVNTPGQSGDPDDPHYRDLAGQWRDGAYFPLLYSRASVERNAEKRILLLPRR